jgi:hypothetical protein
MSRICAGMFESNNAKTCKACFECKIKQITLIWITIQILYYCWHNFCVVISSSSLKKTKNIFLERIDGKTMYLWKDKNYRNNNICVMIE